MCWLNEWLTMFELRQTQRGQVLHYDISMHAVVRFPYHHSRPSFSCRSSTSKQDVTLTSLSRRVKPNGLVAFERPQYQAQYVFHTSSSFFRSASRAHLSNPIFNSQTRHTFKLSYVVGDQYQFVGKRVGRDPQIVVADGFAAGLQMLADFSVVC